MPFFKPYHVRNAHRMDKQIIRPILTDSCRPGEIRVKEMLYFLAETHSISGTELASHLIPGQEHQSLTG